MNTIESQLLLWSPKLAMAVAILFCFWIVSKIAQAALKKSGDKINLKEPIRSLVSEVVKISILVFGVVTSLGTLAVPRPSNLHRLS